MEEKFVVAPQIVIYKNIFKHSQELIDELEVDKENSLFNKWEKWYEQGHRKSCVFEINSFEENKEIKFLKEIVKAIEYIKQDYFSDFGFSKGVWPGVIQDWNILTEAKNFYYIDYFKYNGSYFASSNKEYAMDYHVDDFLLEENANGLRHAVTINFYLNSNYNGGEICAYDSKTGKSYKYKPNPGDAVVMPSTKPFYHAVKSFDNDRYFLRSFIDYPVSGDLEWKDIVEAQKKYVLNDRQIIKIKAEEERIV